MVKIKYESGADVSAKKYEPRPMDVSMDILKDINKVSRISSEKAWQDVWLQYDPDNIGMC